MASGLAQSLMNAAALLGNGRGGMVAGMVASQTVSNQAQQSAQQAQQAQMDTATASQRRDHLAEMFEHKRCKVSELKK